MMDGKTTAVIGGILVSLSYDLEVLGASELSCPWWNVNASLAEHQPCCKERRRSFFWRNQRHLLGDFQCQFPPGVTRDVLFYPSHMGTEKVTNWASGVRSIYDCWNLEGTGEDTNPILFGKTSFSISVMHMELSTMADNRQGSQGRVCTAQDTMRPLTMKKPGGIPH